MPLGALFCDLADKSNHGFLQSRLMVNIGLFSVQDEVPVERERPILRFRAA